MNTAHKAGTSWKPPLWGVSSAPFSLQTLSAKPHGGLGSSCRSVCSSMPHVGLELTAPRSGVARSTNGASRARRTGSAAHSGDTGEKGPCVERRLMPWAW